MCGEYQKLELYGKPKEIYPFFITICFFFQFVYFLSVLNAVILTVSAKGDDKNAQIKKIDNHKLILQYI